MSVSLTVRMRLRVRLAVAFFCSDKHHESSAHETGYGIIFVEGVLDAGNDFTGRIASLVGEGQSYYSNYNSYSSYECHPTLHPFRSTPLVLCSALSHPLSCQLSPGPPELHLVTSSLFSGTFRSAVKADLFSTAIATATGLCLVDPISLPRPMLIAA